LSSGFVDQDIVSAPYDMEIKTSRHSICIQLAILS